MADVEMQCVGCLGRESHPSLTETETRAHQRPRLLPSPQLLLNPTPDLNRSRCGLLLLLRTPVSSSAVVVLMSMKLGWVADAKLYLTSTDTSQEKSSARVTVSESIPGNPERILNVSGPLDAVAKAFGLIVRRINDEPFDVPSVPGSRAVTIKFIIPNSRMGSVIGKGGSKIKEIQEASGARLNASEAMLPGSTERVLSVSGVADAVHIAVYYIGTILLEYQDRYPSNATGSYKQSQSRGPPPNSNAPPPPGMQTQQIFIPNALVGASKLTASIHFAICQF